MRLVQVRGGTLEIRWTWLPFWLAINPQLKHTVDREMRDRVLLGGVTNSEEDLEALHEYVIERLERLFPAFSGLGGYLRALEGVGAAEEPSS